MNESEYQTELQSIATLAALVQRLQIRDVLQAINHADTIGPLLVPTLYIEAAAAIERQRRIVQAALQFQQAIKKIVSEYRASKASVLSRPLHTEEKKP